jgi:hypothetical protein
MRYTNPSHFEITVFDDDAAGGLKQLLAVPNAHDRGTAALKACP